MFCKNRMLVGFAAVLAGFSAWANTYYVAENGDDGNGGTSWDDAFRTVQAAVDAASADGGDTIIVGDGRFYSKDASSQRLLLVNKPVTIKSLNGPGKTFLDGLTFDQKGNPVTSAINMALLKVTADATISGITFTNGCNSSKGNIWKIDNVQARTGVEMTAGTLTNCVVHARYNWKSWIVYAGGTAKLCDVTVPNMSDFIRNGELAQTIELYGDAVMDGLRFENATYSTYLVDYPVKLSGNAILRNAIVTGCTIGSATYKTTYPPVVRVEGKARLEHSTIAGAYINGTAGALSIGSATCVVTNCIVHGNTNGTGSWPNLKDGANLARCWDCCSSDFTWDDAVNSWRDPRFTDAANDNYRLLAVSPVPNCGASSLRAKSATDFDCGFDATVRKGRGTVTTTFSGYTTAGTDGMTACWHFDDGTTSTDWPTASHTFTTPGWHGATLYVTNGNDRADYLRASEVLVSPETAYVKEGNAANAVYPYTSWKTAAADIQSAVDTGARNVWVTNGTYGIGAYGTAPAIRITTDARVRSVEGPDVTIVDTGITGAKNGTDRRHFTLGHADAEVVGFTLVGGNSGSYDYTASIEANAGVISNCIIRGVRRLSRSCVVTLTGTAKMYATDIDATGHGINNPGTRCGGLRLENSALADRCRITGLKVVSQNATDQYRHAAVFLLNTGTILRNSLVYGNTNGTAQNENITAGGVDFVAGRIENCTITENTSYGRGGGLYIPNNKNAKVCVNTIISGNTASIGGTDVYCCSGSTCTFLDSCGSDLDGVTGGLGEGCTLLPPSFDEDRPYHLSKYSTACVDKGTTNGAEMAWAALPGAVDLDGTNRVVETAIDMGCFEFVPSKERIPLEAKVEIVGAAQGRSPVTVSLVATLVGDTKGLQFRWDFGDGTSDTEHLEISHTYASAGSFTPTFWVTNDEGEEQTVPLDAPVLSVPETCYVSTTGGNVAPYTTWADAATDVQSAVALGPKHVVVTNGAYDLAGEAIVIATDLELRSVEGREKTILVGHASAPWSTKRLVWLKHGGAVCRGFTLKGGYGADNDTMVGVVSAGLLEDCFVTDNNVNSSWSPMFQISGTGVVHNVAINVGTPYYLSHEGGSGGWSVIASGHAVIDGLVMTNFYRNYSYGGGNVNIANLTLKENATARNVLLKDIRWASGYTINDGYYHAVVAVLDNATFESATIVNCQSMGYHVGDDIYTGGALYMGGTGPIVRNVLLQDNLATYGGSVTDVYDRVSSAAPRITYSRSSELTTGEGNVTARVRTHTVLGWPDHPYPSSASANRGYTTDWMREPGATDVKGSPRIVSGRADIGCYETAPRGVAIIVR